LSHSIQETEDGFNTYWKLMKKELEAIGKTHAKTYISYVESHYIGPSAQFQPNSWAYWALLEEDHDEDRTNNIAESHQKELKKSIKKNLGFVCLFCMFLIFCFVFRYLLIYSPLFSRFSV
jgi:hypothetical protein